MSPQLISVLLRFLSIILLLTHGARASPSAAPACNLVVNELNPCVPYLVKNEAKPSDSCCAGVMSLMPYQKNKAARQSICECLEAVSPMYPRIDNSLISALPNLCGVSLKLPAVSPGFDCTR